MSIKAKIATGAATFALVGSGLGMAGTLTASAATPSCGANCVQIFSQKYGPRYVVDTYQARAKAGQPAILFQSSNSDPAEDFTFSYLGSVHSFYRNHGLASPGFDGQPRAVWPVLQLAVRGRHRQRHQGPPQRLRRRHPADQRGDQHLLQPAGAE